MASQKFEKGSAEWNFFMDLWKLTQTYYVPELDNDDYHESLLRDTVAFDQKYNTAWSREFAAAVTRSVHDIEESMLEKEKLTD